MIPSSNNRTVEMTTTGYPSEGIGRHWQDMLSSHLRRLHVWITALTVALVVFLAPYAVCEESKEGASDSKPENDPIQITANQLISNNNEKYAEFIGNVKASQGKFMITSDRLKIYYEGDLLNPEKKSAGDEVIKKIVGQGNVKITAEQYLAESDQVEYDTDSMTIVLRGENSTVTSGKNSISGSIITLYRKDGQVKVEGSSEKRIKAVFYSTGKTTDVFTLESSEKPKNPPTP
jgi:lipopolysaccharide export system protein LptA